MIEIHREELTGIPALHAVKSGNMKKELPLIFFVHGFTSAKEHNLHFAYLLADKGFRVILPDAMLHGERADGRTEAEMMYEFWNIVVNTISELDLMKNKLAAKGLINDHIGVVGTSMGGIVNFGALTQFNWIKAGVSLMGSPAYEAYARGQIQALKREGTDIPYTDGELEEMYRQLKKYDLTMQPETLNGRPLFIWHGKKDPVVPFGLTYDFYTKIRNDYQKHPERLQFLADERAGHKVTREALLKTVQWFTAFLKE
ncbi:prolyl oligopeptidase family serine peptidase [Siminovitchia sp. 179-K 8D1 HS]|uniref:prolyl oligopeptidase family serine peptidase n=1 Tax=Siminovitchia sp. 179-K 8D1 HS TaxID=3142385 RepID=UPI0039A10544